MVYDPATIYYLPETTGWDSIGYALPTALWLPQMQPSSSTFGIQSNPFAFNINWASGLTVIIEASTSLVNANWSPVSTNTLDQNGRSFYTDPASANYSGRFYRVRSP